MTKDETPENDAAENVEADVELEAKEAEVKQMDDAEVLMYVEEATPKLEDEDDGKKKKTAAAKLPAASAPDQEAIHAVILDLEELTFTELNERLGGPLVERLIALADKGLLARTFKGGRYRYAVTTKGHKLIQSELG